MICFLRKVDPIILSHTEYSDNFSFPLESSYICASVTGGKETVKNEDLLENETLPYHFNFLTLMSLRLKVPVENIGCFIKVWKENYLVIYFLVD